MATANQIAYWQHMEKKRSNLANESLGKQTLSETARSNAAKEAHAWASLQETQRHNRAGEVLGQQQHSELVRSNLAREVETNRSNIAKETETERSNLAKEKETNRSNLANEAETNRHNAYMQFHADVSNMENERHNMAMENISRTEAETHQADAETRKVKVLFDLIKLIPTS